ncbi:MAG: 4-hydroxybenzoate octaprenyltransferase [Xanthomonadales bacterium]|nr:4-hydroxybenzoate octaprenyltransferase [Xanthomonadales bacterium]MCC6594702.1 4-hydroxybenzoate octaprenyltransferase [Xanthomonadales bacterium]MCE7932022.1 4-hydroxybenzoate octaprenyltransferase [Xanthomonadales bacterium PRO6]
MPNAKPAVPNRPHYRLVETQAGRRVIAEVQAVKRSGPTWSAWARLMRLDKPIGILLLLWPTLWALWLAAKGPPPLTTLAIFVGGVLLTRSAGCAINDYADRWLDPDVERTRQRPLATGEISGTQALALFALLMLAALGLVLLTNRLTVYLAIVALMLAVAYPYMKRAIWFPQVVLGAAFGMSIPMAWTAIQGMIEPLAVLLFCANLLWTTAYDTLYAMVDREDDLKAGARSTAILFGDLDLVAIGILQGSALATLLLVGQRAELGWPFHAGLGLAAALVGWQLWIARGRGRDACFRAFLNNNWVGAAVFVGIAGSYALAVRAASP